MEHADTLSGRYRIGPLLGRGGMADVYQAEDVRLRRAVAVKILRPELARDPDVRNRFEAEGRWAANLSHPSIVGVYDVGEDDGRAYLVMELLPGRTLADRLDGEPMPEAEAVNVIRQVLSALGSAHAAGVLHRDIKPANILFTADGAPKLVDFGIAKALDREAGGPDETTANLVFGTPSYVAPERMQGQPASVASDLWAVGVVLYEMLGGARPFTGDTAVAVALAAERGRPVPLRERNPAVSPRVAAAVERALQPAPQARFASAAEMALALGAAPDATVPVAVAREDLATIAVAAPDATTVLPASRPAAPSTSPPARPRRSGAQIATLVFALLLVIGIIVAVAFAVTSKKSPEAPSTPAATSTSAAPSTRASTTTSPATSTSTATSTTVSSTTSAPATTSAPSTTAPRTTTTSPPPSTSVTVSVP